MLVNAIGYIAEAAYHHHPDLAVTWGRVVVKLSTHSAGGYRQETLPRPTVSKKSPSGARPKAVPSRVRRTSSSGAATRADAPPPLSPMTSSASPALRRGACGGA